MTITVIPAPITTQTINDAGSCTGFRLDLPCEDAHCGHPSCAETRAWAALPCARCGRPLGFLVELVPGGEEMVHRRCPT